MSSKRRRFRNRGKAHARAKLIRAATAGVDFIRDFIRQPSWADELAGMFNVLPNVVSARVSPDDPNTVEAVLAVPLKSVEMQMVIK